MSAQLPLFRVYTQIPTRLPPSLWQYLRRLVLACALGIIILAITAPRLGLAIFWGIYVPGLPLLFLVAPGAWRNVCPMATLNQIPRRAGFTRGWTLPPRVQQVAPLVSAGLFLLVVPARKVLLDHSGPALAAFLVTVLCLAFLGGVCFKGKSGWCSQFCPMLGVERFYGQSPLVVLPNAHCRPCVGCTNHCYDFNPTAAYLQDLHHPNRRLGANRTLFAGALPGLILGFFTQPALAHPTFSDMLSVYGRTLLFVAAGIGLIKAIEALGPLTPQQVVLCSVAVTLNLFYWFVAPPTLARLGLHGALITDPARAGVALLALWWLRRAWPREQAFLHSEHAPAPTVGSTPSTPVLLQVAADVTFASGPTVQVTGEPVLLDVALDQGLTLAAGCRMGMCGADPVWVVAGAEALSTPTPAERATLERLGLGPACRLACCARVQGSVTVALDQAAAAAAGPAPSGEQGAGAPAVTSAPPAPAFPLDPEVRRVVVIGGGVAGTTAATEVRRLHPAALVTVLGAEPYDAYNRMAVDRLLSTGRLDKLYLLPRDWAAQRGIRALCGVEVTAIDCAAHRVYTQDGAVLPYDRLVLAMGAGSTVPTLQGYGMPGSFVLRTADDALQLAAYMRDQRPRAAVVLGGGPVGLEAADKLREKGLEVTVLDRNPWLLARHLDHQAGSLLRHLLEERGIRVIAETTACQLVGSDRLRRVICADGLCLDTGLCLVALGTAANTSLAAMAGLAVRRGVIVDDHLRTSDPHVYAVGDVAEHEGHIAGLWQTSIEQARLASVNLLGGNARYQPAPVPLALKISGIDLLAVGTLTPPKDGGEAVCFEHHAARTYWKLVVQAGTARGAVVIGDPDLAGMFAQLVTRRADLEQVLARLERGDWSAIAALLAGQERRSA